jgi:hypothetical protein
MRTEFPHPTRDEQREKEQLDEHLGDTDVSVPWPSARHGRTLLHRGLPHASRLGADRCGDRIHGGGMPSRRYRLMNAMADDSAEIFDDLYLGLRAGGALRKQRRGESLSLLPTDVASAAKINPRAFTGDTSDKERAEDRGACRGSAKLRHVDASRHGSQ